MFIFHIVPFLLILKCLVTFTSSENSTSITSTLNNSTKAKTTSSEQFENTSDNLTKVTASIIGEGGAKFLITDTSLNTPTMKSTTEHVDIKVKNTPAPVTKVYGREGEIINVNQNQTIHEPQEKKQNVSDSISSEAIKPVTEPSVPIEKLTNTTHSRIVPKKGVVFNETTIGEHLNTTVSITVTEDLSIVNTTAQPTTIIKQPRKPTVTTGSEDKKDALVKQNSSNSTPKVPTIEYYQNKKEDRGSAFIIPIVAVILSVPLVAIVLNILYKRGKEWWSHRHYSRMDFLIDGMYNN